MTVNPTLAERSNLELIKAHALTNGIIIQPAALDNLTSGGSRSLSIHEYPTTGGITLELPHGVLINAPFDEWFCDSAQLVLEWDGEAFLVTGRKCDPVKVVEVLPLPGYLGVLDDQGDSVDTVCMSHADRIRLSPIIGCAYDCAFCDLPGFDYEIRSVERLIRALRVAEHDRSLPATHVLLSGGSPRRTHYEQFTALICDVVAACELPVDVMMSPMVDGQAYLDQMIEAGVHSFSINLEVYDETQADLVLGRKNRTSRNFFESTIRHLVGRLGPHNGLTRSLIIPGLETFETTIEGVRYLAEMGCTPVLSPFRPASGIALSAQRPPSADQMLELLAASREIVASLGGSLGPHCLPCQHNVLAFPWDN